MEKSSSYVCMQICVHIYEEFFSEHDLATWHLHCSLDFWTSAYRVLERALHIKIPHNLSLHTVLCRI